MVINKLVVYKVFLECNIPKKLKEGNFQVHIFHKYQVIRDRFFNFFLIRCLFSLSQYELLAR